MSAGKVALLRQQFQGGSSKPAPQYIGPSESRKKHDVLAALKENMDRVQPGLGELFEKEKPLIAELIVKMKNRELNQLPGDSYSSMDTIPGPSVISDSSSDSLVSRNDNENPAAQRVKRKAKEKTPMQRLLADMIQRELFRAFLERHSATHYLDFWEACEECEKRARGCANLAKKIINQLMTEIKETNGKPEQSHMEVALNAAVVAVRYELISSKEETHSRIVKIANEFVRETSPRRVSLSSDKRLAFLTVADAAAESVPDAALTVVIIQSQNDILDLIEEKYYAMFCREHGLNQDTL